MKESPHLSIQPFGQIPTYAEGELHLFESGAIVLHIAERHGGLLPDVPDARARAIAWMFAALNTVEMIGVLFRTKDLGLLERYSNLRDYVARGDDRPAFRRAFAAQRAVFEANQQP